MTPTNCTICGTAIEPRFSDVRDPQSGEAFAIEACASCGLGHTSPVPENLGRYYGAAYYGGRHGFTARYCAQRRCGFLERAAGKSGRLLDIGCGDGTFLAAAKERNWTVAGTELGPNADRARAQGLDVRESLTDFEPPFNAVTMWHTLEHFTQPLDILSQAHRLLDSNGALIAAVPDAGGLQAAMFGARWFHLDVPRHLHHFDRHSLEELLKRAGFAVERWHHQEFEYDLFGWLQSALNTMMPAPNVLFNKLTGKPSRAGAAQVATSFLLGGLLGPLALGATAAGTLAARGGTLIAVARKRSEA